MRHTVVDLIRRDAWSEEEITIQGKAGNAVDEMKFAVEVIDEVCKNPRIGKSALKLKAASRLLSYSAEQLEQALAQKGENDGQRDS